VEAVHGFDNVPPHCLDFKPLNSQGCGFINIADGRAFVTNGIIANAHKIANFGGVFHCRATAKLHFQTMQHLF
jgi:hypothetical protein